MRSLNALKTFNRIQKEHMCGTRTLKYLGKRRPSVLRGIRHDV